MSQQTYKLDQNGIKETLDLRGNLFVDLGNGTTLELVMDNPHREHCLTIHSRTTGELDGETESSPRFSTLTLMPGAANVMDITAQLHKKKRGN